MKKLTKKSVKELEDKFSYTFCDRALLEKSLTHKSFVNELKGSGREDNERLEFLGDAVLNLMISQLLMEYFPKFDEGFLSRKRSSIVSEKSLARFARRISLGDYLLLGKGEEMTKGREKDSLLANAVEAIIGAIYLDGGLDASRAFIGKNFRNVIRYSAKPGSYKDYKTYCQELAQKIFKKTPQYRLINVKGPEHKKAFESEVVIGSLAYGRGKGRSKKDSEQRCAKAALKKLEKLL